MPLTTSRSDGGTRRRNGGRRISHIAIGLCLAAIGASAIVLRSEIRLAADQQRLVTDTAALARGEAPPAHAEASAMPRLALVEAVGTAQRAAATRDPAVRAALLARADAAAERAVAARPHWGEAAIAAAYARSLRTGGAADPQTVAMLVRSYDDAPFLKDAAGWRIAAATAAWAALPERTRSAAVDEAVWLVRRSGDDEARAMFDSARGSPLYAPFMLRWREIRATDPL